MIVHLRIHEMGCEALKNTTLLLESVVDVRELSSTANLAFAAMYQNYRNRL